MARDESRCCCASVHGQQYEVLAAVPQHHQTEPQRHPSSPSLFLVNFLAPILRVVWSKSVHPRSGVISPCSMQVNLEQAFGGNQRQTLVMEGPGTPAEAGAEHWQGHPFLEWNGLGTRELSARCSGAPVILP